MIEVPPGSDVRLLPPDEEVSERFEHKVWFALWGYWPLGDNTTAELIREHDLSEVRFDAQGGAQPRLARSTAGWQSAEPEREPADAREPQQE